MQRKPTIHDVARVAGVGTMTVSRVLNNTENVAEATAKKVRAAVAQLDYHPNELARALRNFKTRTIGILLPNLHDPFYATIAHALNMVAKEHGYTVLLTLTNDDSRQEYLEAQRMMQRHIEGLIVIPATSESCRLGEREFHDLPIVTLDLPLPADTINRVDSVLTENETGGRLATEHLIHTHGFERILFVGHKPGLYTMEARSAGYISAMREAGLKPDYTFECHSNEAAMQIIQRSMDRKQPPQAIFSANNVTTRQVLSALLRLRLRVPEQIALAGFDELELSDLLHPALTVVRQPMEELGRTAARILFAKMKKQSANKPSARTVLPLQLVVRHSCGCPYEPGQQTNVISTQTP